MFIVYKDGKNLVVHNISSNETIIKENLGTDFGILKINSETYSNYIMTTQGTDIVSYYLNITETEVKPEIEETEETEEIEEIEEAEKGEEEEEI